MMSKSKIFDVILVFNEYDLLEERIKLFEPNIEKFVILDFGSGCKNYSCKNIVHIKTSKDFLAEDFDLLYEVIRIIDSNNLYVEDILMVSKVNEIPDINVVLNNIDLIQIKPIVFQQKKVFWESDYVSQKFHFSSFAFTYSQYLFNKNLYNSFTIFRTPIPINYSTLECGWQLNGFQNKSDLKKSYEFWNEKEITENQLRQLHSGLLDFENNLLIEIDNEIPKQFLNFQTKEKLRESKTISLTLEPNLFQEDENMILLIEENKIISNNGLEFNFTLPVVEFYEGQNTSMAYAKNQTIKILKHLNCLPHDIIVCHKKETLDKVTLTYQEFLQNVPSELF